MDSKKYDELIFKYFEGKASIEEEKKLEDLVRKRIISDPYLDSILLIKDESQVKEAETQFLNKIEEHKGGKVKIVRLYQLIAVAACVVLVFLFVINGKDNSSTSTDAYTQQEKGNEHKLELNQNEKIAYAEAKDALMLISSKLNKANHQLSKINLINSKNPIKF